MHFEMKISGVELALLSAWRREFSLKYALWRNEVQILTCTFDLFYTEYILAMRVLRNAVMIKKRSAAEEIADEYHFVKSRGFDSFYEIFAQNSVGGGGGDNIQRQGEYPRPPLHVYKY